jgi:hypothetical protein
MVIIRKSFSNLIRTLCFVHFPSFLFKFKEGFLVKVELFNANLKCHSRLSGILLNKGIRSLETKKDSGQETVSQCHSEA